MSSACKACHTIDTFVTQCSAFRRSGWVLAITSISDVPAREREGASARKHLSAEEFSAASWLIITMNALNRVSLVSQHPVRRRDE
jgi:hypothetical protein